MGWGAMIARRAASRLTIAALTASLIVTGATVKTLRPVMAQEATNDVEALDQGAPPVDQAADDVETLDQGSPPSTAAAPVETVPGPVAVETTSAAPVDTTTYTTPAPAAPSGPTLPPGFGTGRVRASAGRFGFPIGLASCHVGAVTGRAYVGLDCEDGEDVVGHAPSFDDFPFVLEAVFPFEGDEAFFTNPNFPFESDDEPAVGSGFFGGNEKRSRKRDVLVSSAGAPGQGRRGDDITVEGTEGASVVELAQRSKEREPRVRVGKDNDGKKAKKQHAQRAGAESSRRRASAQQQVDDASGKDSAQAKKSKNSKKAKKSKDRKERREKRNRS